MPRKRKSAHEELQERIDAAAAEQTKLREAELALNEAKANVDRIGAEIELAYADEDEPLAARHRQRLGQAEDEVQDRQRRYKARRRRADESSAAVDNYRRERAKDLIAERDGNGNHLATELQATLERVAELDRRWSAHAQETNQLVALVDAARPPNDGCPTEHAFSGVLTALRRELAGGASVPAPTPRWDGLAVQRQQDAVHRLLRLKRERKRDDEQLEQLRREIA
jgi:hypothetical protein